MNDMLNTGVPWESLDVDEVKVFLPANFKLKDMGPIGVLVWLLQKIEPNEIYINQSHMPKKV